MRAVRAGEAVVDPRDAPLAVDAAIGMQRLLQRRRLSSWWPLVLLCAVFVTIGLIGGNVTRGEGAYIALVAGGFAAARYGALLPTRRAVRRARQAEARNREIVKDRDAR